MRSPPKAHRILVTGASGFVGRYLVAHLRALEIDVIAWGLEAARDIRDVACVDAAIKAERPDAVIHLAAVAAPAAARSDPRTAWDVNVTGTFNLAQAVRTHCPDTAFVFVGSSECYGASFNATGNPIAESAALDPTNAYGATKAAADLMIGQMARDGLRAVRLRPFNHTGPGQEATYVVSDFARQIATIEAQGEGGALRVGNLDAKRDILDVRDVVSAYAAAAMADDIAPGTAINISTGRPLAIRVVLDHLVAASSSRIRVEVDASRLRPQEVACTSGDPLRAGELLGWRPQIALTQTLADVLDYWRDTLRSSHGR